MIPSDKKFLVELLETPSPTGFELRGQKVWAKQARKYADNVENDAYGNVWATIKGTSDKSFMIEAHADEIGFMVKYITEKGFLAVDVIGGSDVAVARGRRLRILGEKGEVSGIIGNTAIHIRDKDEKMPKVHELFVDVGAKDEKEVEKMGIRVGSPAVPADGVMELGKHCITSRAIDNRLGGFIAIEVMKAIRKTGKKPAWTLHFVNAIQEEVGGFGARMIAHRLHPTAAICFDVCHSTDTPGIKHEQHGKVLMNEGPTVTHGGCNHPLLVERIIETATKKKIPFQHEASSRFSGTDTQVIFFTKEGIPSALVSCPVRYMHSVVETVDLRDVEKTVKLLTETVLSLKKTDAFAVKV